MCVCVFWAQVRETTGAQQKQSPYYEDLLKAQESAQAGSVGLWNKVRPARAAAAEAESSKSNYEEMLCMAFHTAQDVTLWDAVCGTSVLACSPFQD